jgi:hypothetical protein
MGRKLSKKTAFKTAYKEFSNLNSVADERAEVSWPVCPLQPLRHLIYARPNPTKQKLCAATELTT